MLKDNWDEKHGINLPGHQTCSKGIQGTHVGNMILQPLQGFSDNDYLTGSSSRINSAALAPSGSTSKCSVPQKSNLQDGNPLLGLNGQGNRYGLSISEPKSVETVGFSHQLDNRFHQNHLSGTRPTYDVNPCGNGVKRIGSASHNMASQLQPSLLPKTMQVVETHNSIDNVYSQTEAHKSLHHLTSYTTDATKALVDSNLQELIKFLSTNHGLNLKTPLEMGSPEYLRLVEILQQSSVEPNGFGGGLNRRGCSQEEFSGGSKQSGSHSKVGGTSNTSSVEIASLSSVSTEQDEMSRMMHNEGQFGDATNCFGNKSESINGGHGEETIKVKEITAAPSTHKPKLALTEEKVSVCRDNQDKMLGHGQKNDSFLGPPKMDEKNLPSEKAARVVAEKLWEGSLQLSSSVTLSAVAFFKSGEKLLGNNWPEFIEVKGKVRLEAFEKYVQDLPRSRNRGLMVISVCWNEGSSNIGLTGMKEVAKGYKRSSRVGFAQLLSGIDLYICPRSDPIITILAKYGFFKGMAVIDDKQDSMIGCVVWRKNRPTNPVGNTLDSKSSPNLFQPQNPPSGLSIKQGAQEKSSPEKLAPESSQQDEPVILPSTTTTESSKNVASAEVDHSRGQLSSSSSSLQISVSSDPRNVARKRPFEDDDLPEFDFGVACGKSVLVRQPLNPALSRKNGLVSVNCQKLDKSRLTQLPSVVNTVGRDSSNGSLEQLSKKTKLFEDDDDDMPEWCPPELQNQMPPQSTNSNFQALPSCPPNPPRQRANTCSSFSYQLFRPPISSPPSTFMKALPPRPLASLSSGRFNPNQALGHQPSSSNVNPSFQSSVGRRPNT